MSVNRWMWWQSWAKAQRRMADRARAVRHRQSDPLYRMWERGHAMGPIEIDTEAELQHYATRWALLPPGKARALQGQCIVALLEGEVPPACLTKPEIQRITRPLRWRGDQR